MAISSYLVPGIFLTVFDENEKNKIYGNLEEDAPIEYRSILNNLGRRWTFVWQANLKFQNGPNLTNTRGSSAAGIFIHGFCSSNISHVSI